MIDTYKKLCYILFRVALIRMILIKLIKERNLELFSKQVVAVLDPTFEHATFASIEASHDHIMRISTQLYGK